MNAQEIVAYVIVAAAVGFLAIRYLRRRASANCCGQDECPAAAETLKRLQRDER